MFADLDPTEQEKNRRRQIVYLARYGRQSMLQWDDVTVLEMLAMHDELSELVGDENAKAEG